MKTPFLGLRTVGYMVGDIKEAKAWYTRAFETVPYFDEPFYVGYNIGGFELGLMPEENPTSKTVNVLTYWGVDDAEESYNRLLELGAMVHEEPKNVGGDIVVATVKDPWENVIGLIYNPDFKIDES